MYIVLSPPPPTPPSVRCQVRGNNLKDFNDVRIENGSRRDQNLALTALCVPSSLDSGHSRRLNENRVVKPTVLPTVGRRGLGGSYETSGPRSPTAYRRQYRRPNYPVVG